MREPLEKCYWQARDFAKRQQMVDADFLEKFAELIVQECVKSLWTEECRISDLASEEYTRGSNKIKKHFGVEQ